MVINNKISPRIPSVNRFYRHLIALISKGCTDVRFELRIDGKESKAFHRIDGKAYEYTGDLIDAHKALEEMIPELGELATGHYIKELNDLGWDNAANVSCKYCCTSTDRHYDVSIKIQLLN